PHRIACCTRCDTSIPHQPVDELRQPGHNEDQWPERYPGENCKRGDVLAIWGVEAPRADPAPYPAREDQAEAEIAERGDDDQEMHGVDVPERRIVPVKDEPDHDSTNPKGPYRAW